MIDAQCDITHRHTQTQLIAGFLIGKKFVECEIRNQHSLFCLIGQGPHILKLVCLSVCVSWLRFKNCSENLFLGYRNNIVDVVFQDFLLFP